MISLDIDRYEAACLLLVKRFPILNTYIEDRHDYPWIMPGPIRELKVRHLTLGDCDLEDSAGSGWQTIGEIVWEKFSIETGPLCRFYSVSFSNGYCYIGLVVHHYIADAISVKLLMEDLVTLYQSLITGMPLPPLPEAPTFQEYLYGFASWMESPGGELAKAAAVKRLIAFPTVDIPECALQSHHYGETFLLQPELTAALRSTARQLRTTVFIILVSVQNVLLHRHSSSSVVPLRAVTMGRDHSALVKIVGNLADRMYILTDIAGNPSFSEIVTLTQRSTVDAARHAFVRDELVLAAAPNGSAIRSCPAFNYQMIDTSHANVGSCAVGAPLTAPFPSRRPQTLPKGLYYLMVYDDGDKIWGNIRYGRGAIRNFITFFKTALERCCSAPNTRLLDLDDLIQ